MRFSGFLPKNIKSQDQTLKQSTFFSSSIVAYSDRLWWWKKSQSRKSHAVERSLKSTIPAAQAKFFVLTVHDCILFLIYLYTLFSVEAIWKTLNCTQILTGLHSCPPPFPPISGPFYRWLMVDTVGSLDNSTFESMGYSTNILNCENSKEAR